MDRWDPIRRAASDTRSGSVAIVERAAEGVRTMSARKDILRAARSLVRAHPAMGALVRMLAAAYDTPGDEAGVDRFVADLRTGSAAASDSARWLTRRRRIVVVTCSWSQTVIDALERIAARIDVVRCMVSLPGGEGRRLARRLETMGIDTEVLADAAVARACSGADLVLVGADAVTGEGVLNKVGTYPLVLAAADAGAGCYALAPTQKFVPGNAVRAAGAFEETPLRLFDAILTERGPRRPAAVRRTIERIQIADPIARIAR